MSRKHSKRKSREGIAVILSMGLGDLLFAAPTIQAIKKQHPDEKLTLITSHTHLEIAKLIRELDDVMTYQRKDLRSLFAFSMRVRRHRFRKVIVLNPVFRGSVLAWLSGASERIGYIRDYERQQSLMGLKNILLTHYYQPLDKKMHEVDRYLDLLKMSEISPDIENAQPKLVLPDDIIEKGRERVKMQKFRHSGKLVVLNIGAAWSNRRWRSRDLAALADWLGDVYDLRVLFVGGNSEKRFFDRISKRMKSQPVSVVGNTSLMQLVGILANADLVITHDTGPMHIAAALDKPMVALFGPGDLVKVRPRASKCKVIGHPMPCSPCKFQYTNQCENNLCMQEIQLEEVQEAVVELLGLESPEDAEASSSSVSQELVSSYSERKKRILYLQSTSEVSGTDITLLRTLEELDRAQYEPHVVLHKEGPFIERYKQLGCQVHIMPSMRKLTSRKGILYLVLFVLGYLPAVFRLAGLIKRHKIKLVHTNTIHNLYGFLAAKIAKVPHIWHIREIVVQSKLLREIEIYLVQKFSDKFIVMDNAIAEAFLKKDRGFPKNIVKIYDGVNLQKFNPKVDGTRIRRELGVEPNTPVVGIVCRLDPWKGLDHFVEVAKHVHDQVPEAIFWVCGGEIEGHEGYESRLREKAESFGLNGNLLFTGWKFKGEDVPEVYRALDVSVQCPTHPEPYGLVNIEAMASGTPIVTFNRGGPSELCVDQKTAFLVSPGDAPMMAKAIVSLLQDRERAAQMARDARDRATRLFNHQKCVKRIEAVYAHVLTPALHRHGRGAH